MAVARRFGLDEVVANFQELEDPRSEINRKQSIQHVEPRISRHPLSWFRVSFFDF